MPVVMGQEVICWAYSCPMGMDESRDKQRTIRTILPAFELSEERKKEGVIRGLQCNAGLLGVETLGDDGRVLFARTCMP